MNLTAKQLLCLQSAAVDDLVRQHCGWDHTGSKKPRFTGLCVNSLIRRQLLEAFGMVDDSGRPTRVRLHVLGRRELDRRAKQEASRAN